MKIFQIILSDIPSSDIRYANELYNGISVNFPECTINQYMLDKNNELTKTVIDLINTYDYLFIHNLGSDKDNYIKLYKFIKCKKILFIPNQDVKRFISKINIEYMHPLITSCYKIVLNKDIKELVDTVTKLSNKENIDKKLVQLDYIYNTDYTVVNDIKEKEIIQISNKGLNSKYDLFINLFIDKKEYFKDFIWKIYGVEKNIQTLSIDNLYINKKTNKESNITNFNEDVIDTDKINIYHTVNNEELKEILYKSYFACCFDNFDFMNYTILDIIYSGTIPVFNINYAKKIKINNKQSVYDIINAIYINDNADISDNLLISVNKYIQSVNSYKSLVLRNINKCNQLYDPKTNITKLFNNIENDK